MENPATTNYDESRLKDAWTKYCILLLEGAVNEDVILTPLDGKTLEVISKKIGELDRNPLSDLDDKTKSDAQERAARLKADKFPNGS